MSPDPALLAAGRLAAEASDAQEARGWLAVDDARHVLTYVRGGRAAQLRPWLQALITERPDRLLGLLVALGMAIPRGARIEDLLAPAVAEQSRTRRRAA